MKTQATFSGQVVDLHEAPTQESDAVLQRLGTAPEGLSEETATERLEVFGPNEVPQERKHEWIHRF